MGSDDMNAGSDDGSLHDSSSGLDPFDAVAENFVTRYRRGERPSMTEYIAQYPHLAERIRRLFPTLATIEQVLPANGPADSEGSGYGTRLPLWERLGDYRIIAELGRGGMGVVYEAEQQSLGRRVALKVLVPSAHADNGRRERFLREARAAARLHHTNIVPVYSIGEEDGICYYAMQLIAGRALDEVLEELRRLRAWTPIRCCEPRDSTLMRAVGSDGSTTLPETTYWQSVARIGLQVAEALVYAHGQGLIHRDIKPSNLLLDIHGNIWVTDFGLAKADEEGNLTRTGDIIGTLRYMAPERLHGHADARSDVYSLGLSLYELATLQPAFTTPDRSTLIQQVAHHQPLRPRRVHRDVPHDLETVILKCIAKDPEDRYRRAEELAADLRCVLECRPIGARRASWRERCWRWCRRNPAITCLTACIGLLVCILALFGTVTAWKLSRQNETIRDSLQRAQQAEREAVHQADKAVRAEAAQRAMRITANEELFASYLAQARAQFGTRRPGQRTEALAVIRAAARIADDIQVSRSDRLRLRDEAALALSQFDLTVRELWPDELPTTSQNRVAFSPDGEYFARAEPGGKLVMRRMHDATVVQEIPLAGSLTDDRPRPFFSSDGAFLVAKGAGGDGSDHAVCVWNLVHDAHGIPCARVAVAGSRFDQAFDISSDSQSFACLGEDRQIQIRNLSDGTLLASLPRTVLPDGLRLSPNGQQLLAWTGTQVEITDLQTRQIAARFVLPSRLDCAAWRSDAHVLACGGEDGQIYIVNASDGVVQRPCVGHQSEVRELAFHPRVDLLASSSWDGTLRLWDLRHGNEVLRMPGALGSFSRCGRWLGFVAGQSVGRAEVSAAPWAMVLAEGDQTVRYVQFSRDSSLLFVGNQQEAGAWDAQLGRRLTAIPGVRQVREHPTRPAWVTAGSAGVCIWPLHPEGRTLRVGPPEVVIPYPCDSIQIDRSGQRWLATSEHNLYFWDDDPRVAIRQHWTQNRIRFVDLSPDGRWIVASGWNIPDVPIWTSGQIEPVARLTAPRGGWLAFSPDDRWLGVSLMDRYELYQTEAWTSHHTFPSRAPQFGPLAWSPDSRSIALAPEPGKLQIVDINGGHPHFTLELHKGEIIAALAFSPDGTRLAAGMRGGAVHVWDLSQLSIDLAALEVVDVRALPTRAATAIHERIDSVRWILE
ncbi:MAG: WD40 repeat domain-containing serine/threonine protein kinase [Pirellulaceae bacterium]